MWYIHTMVFGHKEELNVAKHPDRDKPGIHEGSVRKYLLIKHYRPEFTPATIPTMQPCNHVAVSAHNSSA